MINMTGVVNVTGALLIDGVPPMPAPV
jgi:hypothetical protein